MALGMCRPQPRHDFFAVRASWESIRLNALMRAFWKWMMREWLRVLWKLLSSFIFFGGGGRLTAIWAGSSHTHLVLVLKRSLF